jgi:hypothetical protein
MGIKSFTVIEPERLRAACERYLAEERASAEVEVRQLCESMVGTRITLFGNRFKTWEQAYSWMKSNGNSDLKHIELASAFRSERAITLISLAKAARGNMVMLTADDAHFLVDFLTEN